MLQRTAGFSVIRLVLSAAVGLLLTLGLLLLAAVGIAREIIAEDWAFLCVCAAALLGALPAAFAAARRGRLPGALAACALLFGGVLLLGSVLFPEPFDRSGLLSLIAVYAAATFGGTVLAGLCA